MLGGVGRQRISGRRVRMWPHDRGSLETRALHRDVERSSAKAWGLGSVKVTFLLFVTLTLPSPQAITNRTCQIHDAEVPARSGVCRVTDPTSPVRCCA